MSLQMIVENVPEGLESFYKEVDGKYVLDVEGFDPVEVQKVKTELQEQKAKLKEFRENNINLKTQLEKIGTNQPNLEELVNSKVGEFKARLESIEAERQQLKNQLQEVVLSDKAKEVAIKYGVHESALPDVVNRAKNAFVVEDGKLLPRDKEYRDENGNPLSLEKFMNQLRDKEAPHCFKQSTGTGSKRPNAPTGETTQKLSSVDRIASGLANRTSNKTFG